MVKATNTWGEIEPLLSLIRKGASMVSAGSDILDKFAECQKLRIVIHLT